MPWPVAIPMLLLSCWAPELAPSGGGGAGGDGAGGDLPQDQPAAVDPATWPTPPFTAWTTDGPVSIVGPGGVPVAQLARAGVRVEVLQVLPVRARLRCSGCSRDARDAEGWLQSDLLWWPGAPTLASDHPLPQALELRARWAMGQELPEGTDADALCTLVDAGWFGHPPRWSAEGATMMLEYRDGAWLPPRITGADQPLSGSCTVAAPSPG